MLKESYEQVDTFENLAVYLIRETPYFRREDPDNRSRSLPLISNSRSYIINDIYEPKFPRLQIHFP